MTRERKPWTCSECGEPGSRSICESCRTHCIAGKPDDVEAHRNALDTVIASTDSRRRPN
jgi:hypothetical protein